jgi:hypothetical protein
MVKNAYAPNPPYSPLGWPAAGAGPDPDRWWPYRDEFPQWHVWRGVGGLFYARRRVSSPPLVVRAPDADQLRDRIRLAEAKLS